MLSALSIRARGHYGHWLGALLLLCSITLCAEATAQEIALGANPLQEIIIVPMENNRLLTAAPAVMNVGSAKDPGDLGRLITEQLHYDLRLSGFFELAPPETYSLVDPQQDGMTASTIDFAGWTLVNSDWLIKGTYKTEGKEVLIDLRLFDVGLGKQVHLKWKAEKVSKGHYRRAVHGFVNAMIAHQTSGPPGPFGSHMLFAATGRGNNRTIHSLEMGGRGPSLYHLPRGINILPSWGKAGHILYSHFGENGSELSSFDVKNKESTSISQHPGMNIGADFCPGKDLVALTLSFDGDSEIYTMRSDGSELTRLTDSPSNDTSPSWSPGCSSLAFVSNREGDPQIYTMRADGSRVRRVTYVGDYNTTPEWSPGGKDGSWIAFTARDERNRFDIFIIRPDNSEIYRITQDQGNNEEPSWSPDGRYLVFQSTRDGRSPRLYITRSDTRGSFQTRVADGFGYKTPKWNR